LNERIIGGETATTVVQPAVLPVQALDDVGDVQDFPDRR